MNAVLQQFRGAFEGAVVTPHDADYDEARSIFNAMIDRRPAVIATCAGTGDVVRAITFAREHRLAVSVRGGGHGVSGKALVDDGLVIDLRRMNHVHVDRDAQTVTVQGGALMKDLDRATEPHGLATTGGRVSSTGVGGYVLGGGDGWLARHMGLAADNLLAVEVVTADGRVVTASEHEHPELFWALHGGGGNFGVATSLTLRLHPLPVVTVVLAFWSPDHGRELTTAYRDLMVDAPDALGGGAFFLTAPSEPFVPVELVGRLAFAPVFVYAGPEGEARDMVAPLLSLDPAGVFSAEMSYAELQCLFDDPPGYRNYWSAEYLSALPDAAVDQFCALANDMIVPSPSQHVLIPQGGAVARGDGHWPIPWRHAPWCVHPFGLWLNPEDDAKGIAWARGVRQALQPWATGAVYLNFIGDEGADRVRAGYGPDNLARLVAVKTAYDPDNVFRSNHNIVPAAGEARTV